MTQHTTRRAGSALAALTAVLLLVLTACGGGEDANADPGQMTGSEHAPYQVAATPLTDTDGQSYSLPKDTDKPLTLVFFGYTHCPTECPIVMNTLAAAMPRLSDEERSQVDVVFATTDPARDTRPVLRDYLDRFDSSFIGLTGELDDIVKVAESMKIFVADGEQLESGGYELTAHSTYVSGIQDGGATVIWDMETTPTELADDIKTLLG